MFEIPPVSTAMPPSPLSIEPLGDSTLVVRLGSGADEATTGRVRTALLRLSAARLPGIIDVAPTFESLAVVFDPASTDGDRLRTAIDAALADLDAAAPPAPRVVEIPVAYGGDAGPDLAAVAAHCGLTAEEVVRRHCGARYVVGMIGFAPGFPYLLGLPEVLAVPRRSTPQTRVPAGSVAIAERQTGIYPRASPAGWHVIGRTTLALFDPGREPPTLLGTGDVVRFVPLDPARGA